jgi:phospholipid-binding lipoprotein MlaA
MNNRSAAPRLVALAAAVALLAGCATARAPDERDPLEPLNRTIFEINEALDRAVIKPAAEAYVAVVPQPARTGVSNFFGNLYDFWNVVNNLLQGKVGQALSDAGRIALNSTVGLLGVVDVASRVGLEKSDEDLGQTFGWWGIGSGPYLVLPLFGPSSFRDGTGTITQLALDPVTRGLRDEPAARNTLLVLRFVNNRAELLPADRVLDEAAIDRYAFLRDAFFQRRRNQIWDGNPPREPRASTTAPPVSSLAFAAEPSSSGWAAPVYADAAR